MLSALAELEPQFRKSSQQQLLVEMLLVRFALFDRAVSIEEVLRGLSGGSASGAGGDRTRGQTGASRGETRGPGMEREARRAATLADAPPPASEPLVAEPPASAVAVGQQDSGDWKQGYEQMANDSARSRLTSEAVRAERLAAMRAKDPVLDAAIDELDLELLD
jgi:hypothetical protein